MTIATETVSELKRLGAASYKKVLLSHGIKEPVFGVKIEALKKIQKRVKKDHQLSLDLYETGIYDAQYLAGLMADESRMTKKDLRHWLAAGNCPALCGSVVAWVSAESTHGLDLALDWIKSKKENTAQTGWNTLSNLVSIKDDACLDLAELTRLLRRVEQTIHQQPNHVRYAMNGFIIALGIGVGGLTELAVETGERVGLVSVDMGNTACKVPYAPEHIQKARKRGVVGKKRTTARC